MALTSWTQSESDPQYLPYVPIAEFHQGIHKTVLQITENYNTD
jgi:hypothetical protein